jgi:hypothetical protein
VHASFDLEVWHPVLEFRSDTFARSFEILDGSYYFGLGSHVDRPHPGTGMILRIRGEHVEPAVARLQALEAVEVARLAGVEGKTLASINDTISAAGTEWERGHVGRAQAACERALSRVKDAVGVRDPGPLCLTMESSRVVIGKAVTFGLRVRGKRPRREALASLEIQDAMGRRLRLLETTGGKAPSGPWVLSFPWDGTTDEGLPVPVGEVRILGRLAVDGRPLLPVRGSVLVVSP